MLKNKYPILEYDPVRKAVIEPLKIIKPEKVPEHCVLTFFRDVIDKLNKKKKLKIIKHINTELGLFPMYRLVWKGEKITIMHAGIGAPLSAGLFEEAIATGCKKFIACGCCGVLDKNLVRGTVVIPVSAIRDEGLSYHYVEPAREIQMDKNVIQKLETVLKKHKVKYVKGKTWTTDAFYRETRGKVALRKKEGCITVEMECSAFLAVAKFRKVQFGQLLDVADDVSGEEWDHRDDDSIPLNREKLFRLAVEACLTL